MKLAILFLFFSFSVMFAVNVPIDDAAFTRKLVGVWITDPAEKSRSVGTSTYNTDGTGTESVRLRDQPESASVVVKTQWSVKDGILSLKTIASSDPKRVPVGLELKDRIISVSEDKFVFETHEGYGDSKSQQGVKIKKPAANKSPQPTSNSAGSFPVADWPS